MFKNFNKPFTNNEKPKGNQIVAAFINE